MDETINSFFKFDRYAVDSIEFYQNNEFIPDNNDLEVIFSIEVEIGVLENCLGGKVNMVVDVFENAKENNYPFSLKASISGFFSTLEAIEYEKLVNLLEINGTAVLFPFVRSVIAEVTRLSNISPVIIPLINVHNLMSKKGS